MAKARGQDDNKGERRDDEEPHGGDGEGKRRAGGRTIARWKALAHEELPSGTDEEVAACINRVAQEEGYEYACSAATVAKWRENDGRQPAAAPAVPDGAAPAHDQEGHGIVVLRQLVHLLGKEAVKKLVDSL